MGWPLVYSRRFLRLLTLSSAARERVRREETLATEGSNEERPRLRLESNERVQRGTWIFPTLPASLSVWFSNGLGEEKDPQHGLPKRGACRGCSAACGCRTCRCLLAAVLSEMDVQDGRGHAERAGGRAALGHSLAQAGERLARPRSHTRVRR